MLETILWIAGIALAIKFLIGEIALWGEVSDFAKKYPDAHKKMMDEVEARNLKNPVDHSYSVNTAGQYDPCGLFKSSL